ncbi:MAG: hypothetical protein M1828_004149 [Chrysothrix sp. TS-e1954]|nr:MAG: hypothetical protein M1828_004149 [Chrysothrix sp. TS-e1954]
MTRTANEAYHAKYSDSSRATPRITLYFLQASRSIRIAWLLEELGLPYEVEFAEREQQKAPQALKDAAGNPLGKFPTIRDGDEVIYESGNIVEYLCEKYDIAHAMIPTNEHPRTRVKTFIHAAEGTLAIHGLAVLYARWSFPAELKESNPKALEQIEKGLSVNVQKDLDWLELELSRSTGSFLAGNTVTAADCMMLFSVQFIFARELGTKNGGPWPKIDEWIKRCEGCTTYKEAIKKSGHAL